MQHSAPLTKNQGKSHPGRLFHAKALHENNAIINCFSIILFMQIFLEYGRATMPSALDI